MTGQGDHPAYRIEDDTLREVLLDPAAAERWVAAHRDDPVAVAYLRMLGRLDEARDLGETWLATLEQGSARWSAAAIREGSSEGTR